MKLNPIWLLITCIVMLIGMCLIAYAEPIERSLDKLQPQFKAKVVVLLKELTENYPDYQVVIAETLRSKQRQKHLYNKKLSQTLNSKHLTGEAIDIYFVRGGRVLEYEEAPYHFIGTLCRQIGLTWGGEWKMRDYGHIER